MFSKKRSELLGANKKILDQLIIKEIQQSFNGIKEVFIYRKNLILLKNLKIRLQK